MNTKGQFVFESTVNTIREQINNCQVEITAYNTQFMGASAFCAIMAALAVVLAESKEVSTAMNLFYILPTLYLNALYNLIKYTQEQMRLGSYRRILEHQLNQYLGEKILDWEAKVPQGNYFIIFGGAVQILFYVPIIGLLLWGILQLDKNGWFFFFLAFDFMQLVVVIIMGITILDVRQHVFDAFGYEVDLNGNLNNHLHIHITKLDEEEYEVKASEIEGMSSVGKTAELALDKFAADFLMFSHCYPYDLKGCKLNRKARNKCRPFVNRAIELGMSERIRKCMFQIKEVGDG